MFGGVSATHIDWTMVPYFRYSFYKHFRDGMKFVENRKGIYEMDDESIRTTSVDDSWYTKFPQAHRYAWEMTKKETRQAVEAMFHNLNSLQSRSGGQLPFTSINYGTCTEAEGRFVTRTILEQTLKGLGEHGRTSIFPCQIFVMKSGVNRKPGDPNYDLFEIAMQATAKRIYPNYANGDWTMQQSWVEKDRNMRYNIIQELGNDFITACQEHPDWMKKMRLEWDEMGMPMPILKTDVCEEVSTMGCRTQNGFNINAEAAIRRNYQAMIDGDFDEKFDGIFSAAQRDGRGNIAPQTIVLPEVAMRAVDKFEKNGIAEYDNVIDIFWDFLNRALNDTCDSLKYRFDLIASQDATIAPFMYKNKTMIGYIPDEGIRTALRNGTLAVGMLGMAECLKILHMDYLTDEGMDFAQQIIKAYEDKCDEYKKKYSLNYAVYWSPCESTAGKAMEHFKSKWGHVKGITDHDYFTNSTHVPVWIKMSPFEKIDIECQVAGHGTAGTITYVELESSIQNNIQALETIINYAMDHDIPYFAINVPVDECIDCGWMEEMDVCPTCGSNNIRKLRRLTGYLGADIPNANKWKQSEFKDRCKHEF